MPVEKKSCEGWNPVLGVARACTLLVPEGLGCSHSVVSLLFQLSIVFTEEVEPAARICVPQATNCGSNYSFKKLCLYWTCTFFPCQYSLKTVVFQTIICIALHYICYCKQPRDGLNNSRGDTLVNWKYSTIYLEFPCTSSDTGTHEALRNYFPTDDAGWLCAKTSNRAVYSEKPLLHGLASPQSIHCLSFLEAMASFEHF